MKKCCRSVTLFFLVLLFILSTSAFAQAKSYQRVKNILVLHSYNESLDWTSDQNSGIFEVLKEADSNCNIYVEYLDWKNYPYQTHLNFLYDYYRMKYLNKNIDLLITTDDAALTFALDNRRKIFSDAPIVCSGVNQYKLSELKNKYNRFTGVIEEINPAETINMALYINPTLKNIYVINDNTESGISTGKLVVDEINAMNKGLNVVSLGMLAYDDILKTVRSLDKNSIVFFTSYYSDVNGRIIEFSKASRAISANSVVPIYHEYDFGLNNGAIGGAMLSGRLLGNETAKLATRIINDEKVEQIPFVSPQATRRVFDYEQLKRFNIPLSQLPNSVEVINKPFSFFETYKMLVINVLLIFFGLIIFIILLLFYITKINKMKKALLSSNEELTQTYEELAAADDELKVQLNEISAIQKNLADSEEKYTYLALHDSLTGLPNRRSLFEEEKSIFTNGSENSVALLFIDMDNFKFINDTMGHEFGDELIKEVSKRITVGLDDNCTLYRLGGDEFILLSKVMDRESAKVLASSILNNFKAKFIIKNIILYVSLSIGLALYPEHGENLEEMLKLADIAMYKAKEEGKNRYIIYDSNMNKAFTERMVLEKHLHSAMDKDEFELYYQPQFDIESNRVTGLEALLRWNNPEIGYVSPIKFIKVAEDTHLIIALGDWVLMQACEFLSQLQKDLNPNLTISVNISPLQILQADFYDKVIRIVDQYQIDPTTLELEITESVLIESFDSVCEKLKLLREKGIRIALDDFGKGYSSLSYLRQLPITTLKIDKCFIDDISIDIEDETLTRHIINMGKSLGMTIVAEGVEYDGQLQYLKKYRCNKIQGYLFSKPVPKNDVKKLLI